MKRLSSYFNKKKNFKQLLIMMIRKKEKWKKKRYLSITLLRIIQQKKKWSPKKHSLRFTGRILGRHNQWMRYMHVEGNDCVIWCLLLFTSSFKFETSSTLDSPRRAGVAVPKAPVLARAKAPKLGMPLL